MVCRLHLHSSSFAIAEKVYIYLGVDGLIALSASEICFDSSVAASIRRRCSCMCRADDALCPSSNNLKKVSFVSSEMERKLNEWAHTIGWLWMNFIFRLLYGCVGRTVN